MKTKKKALLTVLCAVMLVVGSVFGTYAYLTDTTDAVTNTFTVGNVKITLTETTNDYKMVPGTTIDKDPVVTVKANSENCWVFVEVTESTNLDNFITYEIASTWTKLTTETTKDVYYCSVPANTADVALSVLKASQVTVKDTVTQKMMDDITNNTQGHPTLTFKAYAIQQEGFTTAAAAWTELNKA